MYLSTRKTKTNDMSENGFTVSDCVIKFVEYFFKLTNEEMQEMLCMMAFKFFTKQPAVADFYR